MREMRALPGGFTEDDGFTGAMDAWRGRRKAVPGGSSVDRRAVPGNEPDIDLRAGADCAGSGAVGIEIFSRGSERACFEGTVPQRDLFYGGGEGGRSVARGDTAVTRAHNKNTKRIYAEFREGAVDTEKRRL